MADAIEKFEKAQRIMSNHWDKNIRVIGKKGRITVIHCDGYTWLSDEEKRPEESKVEED